MKNVLCHPAKFTIALKLKIHSHIPTTNLHSTVTLFIFTITRQQIISNGIKHRFNVVKYEYFDFKFCTKLQI